jgi:hypothetical protein
LLTGLFAQQLSDKDKYRSMARIMDGDLETKVSRVSFPADNFALLKIRLNAVAHRIRGMETISCKLCSILQSSFVHHGTSGCPAIFNMCFTCLGRHANGCCKSALFKVKTGFCWKCWMPLNDLFGISFHSKKKVELGRGCNNAALDFVKHACMHYFYNRASANITCQCTDITEYQSWLFSQVTPSSMSGSGQVPNILLLLEAIMRM